MKKILATLLALVMILSLGVVSYSAQYEEDASLDLPISSADETDKNTASSDEEILRNLVWEFMLTQMNGENWFEGNKYYDPVPYSIDALYEHKGETADYVVFDLNILDPLDDAEFRYKASVKIGDDIYTNEVDGFRVSWALGLGYYVVDLRANEVCILEDALLNNLEGLADWCNKAGISRKIGDADADGKITIKDATYIQKIVAGFEGYAADSFYVLHMGSFADFDNNYTVNVKDATNIQKYLADLPFTYWKNNSVTSITIPEDAEQLNCDIRNQDTDIGEDIITKITSTAEYLEIFRKESDVYNEEYFETKDLVFVNKVFGSGSYGYEAEALYKKGDALYIKCTTLDLKPGFAYTCDMAYRGRYFEVSKTLTEGTNKLFLFEDVLFSD